MGGARDGLRWRQRRSFVLLLRHTSMVDFFERTLSFIAVGTVDLIEPSRARNWLAQVAGPRLVDCTSTSTNTITITNTSTTVLTRTRSRARARSLMSTSAPDVRMEAEHPRAPWCRSSTPGCHIECPSATRRRRCDQRVDHPRPREDGVIACAHRRRVMTSGRRGGCDAAASTVEVDHRTFTIRPAPMHRCTDDG